MKLFCKSAAETKEWAHRLGSMVAPGDVLGLIGPLGGGKTSFVGGLAEGMGIDPAYRVTSPTFVYAHIYPGRVPLYHLDLYRMEKESELESAGLHEMIGGEGVAAVEWFDRFPQLWEGDRLEVHFHWAGDTGREIDFTPFGERPDRLVDTLRGAL